METGFVGMVVHEISWLVVPQAGGESLFLVRNGLRDLLARTDLLSGSEARGTVRSMSTRDDWKM